MYTTATPLLQGEHDLKATIIAAAEELANAAGIPFRPGRLARLIGKALTRDGERAAWLVLEQELERGARDVCHPPVRNQVGVVDPTGALAAARVDAERTIKAQRANKKNAPAGQG